jgi:hypothetical protein
MNTTKKQKLQPPQSSKSPKSPQITPENKANSELHPITIIDTAPTQLQGVTEIHRMIYFLPKVTMKGPEISEAQAETINEDDLHEYFRVQHVFIVYGAPITYNESIIEHIFAQYGQVESVFFHPTLGTFYPSFPTPIYIDSALYIFIVELSIVRQSSHPTFPLIFSLISLFALPSCHSLLSLGSDIFSRIAEVTMADNDEYQAVLKKASNSTPITLNSHQLLAQQASQPFSTPPLFGLAKWNLQYRKIRPQNDVLQNQCDLFMQSYDDRTNKSKKEHKKQKHVVDDEGFTLVLDDDDDFERAAKREKILNKQQRKRNDEKLRKKTESGVHFYRFHERQQSHKQQQQMARQQHAESKIIQKIQKTSFKPL